ncbi:MAG: MiaB/RimO family radical SAM methylthiotransferase, partial [Candidatus Omnitrophica bacterium]|nr:MiaB/RimO family radical SAM methylthiotransferase [Candidatus Omnitrophota bacterium]
IGKKFLKQAPISDFEGHTRAFLKVQDGCNNRCSYCKIPLVRGNSESRPLAQVIDEAQALVNSGFKEIVLCGICLGSFGRDLRPKISLVDILSRMEKIKGLLRIRLSSIEAGDVSEALIGHMARSEIVCRHLHIPMQSGADAVLRRMNRSYRRNDYLKLVGKIRRQLRGVSITTDIMVGFPGESEGDFKDTLSLVEAVEPLRVHIFPYSPRQGTMAHGFDTGLAPVIIQERLFLLKNEALKSSGVFRRRFLNKKTDVLIEKRCKDRPEFWQGYTGNYIRVLVSSPRNLSNQLLRVELKKIDGEGMIGFIRKKEKEASGY